jgi:hypothetical protein
MLALSIIFAGHRYFKEFNDNLTRQTAILPEKSAVPIKDL